MKDDGLNDFTERFAEMAADTDWSRYPQLQAASEYDIRAAAQALWTYLWRSPGTGPGSVSSADVERAMLAQVKRYDDRGELVSVEFEEYWDATDTHRFTSGLLEDMKRELANGFLTERRTAGFIVISNDHGIWIFNFTER